MNGAWADGAPRSSHPSDGAPTPQTGFPADPYTTTGTPGGVPYTPTGAATGATPSEPVTWAGHGTAGRPVGPRPSLTRRASSRVDRIRSLEGLRGMSSRATLLVRYAAYFLAILLFCGLTAAATNGVRYATGGGTFMLFSCAVICLSGAVATVFYVNLRNEIVERVRHYVFGIILVPGTLLAGTLRALQSWEWVNEGSLGTTLQAALPAIFLATVVLPAIVFVKELVGIRTLHRSKLDDEEAVALWTRQDGLQR